jgi:hypothetical protein
LPLALAFAPRKTVNLTDSAFIAERHKGASTLTGRKALHTEAHNFWMRRKDLLHQEICPVKKNIQSLVNETSPASVLEVSK